VALYSARAPWGFTPQVRDDGSLHSAVTFQLFRNRGSVRTRPTNPYERGLDKVETHYLI